MRLHRESVSNIPEDTVEYRTAIKSVIRCQIQSLLQKLAAETGEESILITTNVAAGTYNHLGSHLGKEYLDDGDEFVQVMCEKFTSFCAEIQNHEGNSNSVNHKSQSPADKTNFMHYKSLPPPKRKRLFNTLELPDTPPLKRKPPQCLLDEDHSPRLKNTVHVDYSPGRVDDASDIEHATSPVLESSQTDKENETPMLSLVKVEPKDDSLPLTSSNSSGKISQVAKTGDNCVLEDPSQTSIVNRPKSLIPLANIYKKYGSNKPIKIESPTQSCQEENKSTEKSILRSLYEQPLQKMEEQMQTDNPGSNGLTAEGQIQVSSLSLPTTINDETFTASSENLVLSGYYDSDSYPMYRHKQKHTAGNQNQKKGKIKDKAILAESLADMANIDAHLRTFESGGRLVYACDVCNRELSHLTSYRRHMKLHTMERPHKCPVCSKGFIRKYHCIDHLNKHHKGVGFDPDTLKLTGQDTKQDSQVTTTALSTMTPEPGEYNYTLDQSLLDPSENDMSLNSSQLDQSASAMLSELAKSAAKSQMNILNVSSGSESALENSLEEDKTCFESCDGNQTGYGNCHDNSQEEDYGKSGVRSADISSPGYQSDDMKAESERTSHTGDGNGSENHADVKKNVVTEGIKAIVEHLKTSSRNKRKRVTPKALSADFVN